MTRPRNQPSPRSKEEKEPAEEAFQDAQAANGTVEPDLPDARHLSRLINTTVNRSLRQLLETLVPQTREDMQACVTTRGTVQHIAGPDRTYVLDYDVRVCYRCVEQASSTEGSMD